MFNAFEYFSNIYQSAGINDIYKASGLSNVEELLANLAGLPDCVMVVRDSGDGYLNFRDRRLDTAYHSLYIFCKGKFNDHTANLTAKRTSMAKGIALFALMKRDAENFGDAAYGFDDFRVDYAEIGPIGKSYFGYAFSFTIEHSF